MTRKLMPGPYAILDDGDNTPHLEGVTEDTPRKVIPAIEYWHDILTDHSLLYSIIEGAVDRIEIHATNPRDGSKFVVSTSFTSDPELIRQRLDKIDEWESQVMEELQGQLQQMMGNFGKPDGFNEN